jgi:hypothetical protein
LLITFPNKLVAHTNWNFTVELTDYPADTHLLTIHFYKDAQNKFSIEAAPDSTVATLHRITKTSAETKYEHGTYQYQAMAAAAGEDTYIEEGRVHIYPNLAQSTDPRGTWTKRFEDASAQFDLLCANPTTQVNVDGVAYTYEGRDKLMARLSFLEKKMKKESGEITTTKEVYKARFRS